MRRRRRNRYWLATFATFSVCVAAAASALIPAVSGSDCSPRGRVVSGLDKLFGEIHRAQATAGDDSVVELFSSRGNETWTLLRTLPDGTSCVVATGRGDWRQGEPPVHDTSMEI